MLYSRNGESGALQVDMSSFGKTAFSIEEIKAKNPRHNAEILRSILAGKDSAFTDLAVVNAAMAHWILGKSSSLKKATKEIETALKSGYILDKVARVLPGVKI